MSISDRWSNLFAADEVVALSDRIAKLEDAAFPPSRLDWVRPNDLDDAFLYKCADPESVKRVLAAVRQRKILGTDFCHVPDTVRYYALRDLEDRADVLRAPSLRSLCKTLVFEGDVSKRKFLVVLPYVDKINPNFGDSKLRSLLSRSHSVDRTFKLAEYTFGFAKNGVCPIFEHRDRVPMLLSESCPDVLFLGGGSPDVKWRVLKSELLSKYHSGTVRVVPFLSTVRAEFESGVPKKCAQKISGARSVMADDSTSRSSGLWATEDEEHREEEVLSLGVDSISKSYLFEDERVRIHLCRGSVVNFEGDVLVNAANEQGVGGGGVDGAVNLKGGPKLVEARKRLKVVQDGPEGPVRIRTGTCVATRAFGELKTKFVLHACGPDYRKLEESEGDALLASAYVRALERASELRSESIGFSLLSAGIYKGERSLSDVLAVAFRALSGFFASNLSTSVEEVYLIAFTDAELKALVVQASKNLN